MDDDEQHYSRIIEIIGTIPDATLGDIGKLLFLQGCLLQKFGIEYLQENGGSTRKISSAISMLNAAESALVKSGNYMAGKIDPAVAAERQKLISVAIEKGCMLAFERDGTTVLTAVDAYGRMEEIDRV